MYNPEQSLSIDELVRVGERIYLDELKEKLEKDFMGQYVVIDVENRAHFVDPDRLAAIRMAQEKYGEKLFYIVQIGMLRTPTSNYYAKRHARFF